MNKENASPRCLVLFIVVGVSTATLFLWQVLIAQQRTQIQQTIQVDAANRKHLVTANRDSDSSPLIFAGAGSNLPIIRLLVKEFKQSHPEIKIDVPAGIGSGGGIRAAADGAIAVGVISRPLKDNEKKLGLEVVPYARVATAIAAHPSVADDGITTEELIQIYKGIKSRWRDGQEIIVLTGEPGDSSTLILEQEIPGFKEAMTESQQARRLLTLYTDQEMNQVLTKTPYAIGISDMGEITAKRLPIKPLKFNGVSPTSENVSNGSYTLVKPLSFVFLKDKLPSVAQAFLDFVQSSEGQKIMRANEYLPTE